MKYEVIGPKGIILASGLTKRQADTYCANCGGSVRAENPAPRRAGKSLADLTPGALQKLEAKNSAEFSRLLDAVIADGHGTATFSDMRAMPSPPPSVREYLRVADEGADIRHELTRRREYGGTLKRIKRADNPAARDDTVPGDFSYSNPNKVLGRPWTDATNASIKTFPANPAMDMGPDAVVRLTFPDGEWLQMVFDSEAGAIKTLARLGFAKK